MGLNYMQSERQYNAGAPELEAEVEIEWRPHAPLPYLPITFVILYEMPCGVTLSGAYMKDQEADDDMLGTFTKEQIEQAEQGCISDYESRCDYAQAMAEDGER